MAEVAIFNCYFFRRKNNLNFFIIFFILSAVTSKKRHNILNNAATRKLHFLLMLLGLHQNIFQYSLTKQISRSGFIGSLKLSQPLIFIPESVKWKWGRFGIAVTCALFYLHSVVFWIGFLQQKIKIDLCWMLSENSSLCQFREAPLIRKLIARFFSFWETLVANLALGP